MQGEKKTRVNGPAAVHREQTAKRNDTDSTAAPLGRVAPHAVHHTTTMVVATPWAPSTVLAPLARVLRARSLADAGAALAALPPRLLLPGHCLTVVSWFSDAAPNFMASYWVSRHMGPRRRRRRDWLHAPPPVPSHRLPSTHPPSTPPPLHPAFLPIQLALLAAFGGGIVTALLIQDPVAAPIALFADNDVGLAFTAAWWGLLYSPPPLARPLRAAMAAPAGRAAARACTNALRAGLVTSRVDLAVRKFPGVLAAPLLLGTLAGCAGKLVTDPLVRVARRGGGGGGGARAKHPPTEFAVPGLALRSAAAGAALHWAAVHGAGWLTPHEGLAALTALFVGHGLATDAAACLLAGAPPRPRDSPAAPAGALHWVAGGPRPGGGGGGGGGGPRAPRAAGRWTKARAKKTA